MRPCVCLIILGISTLGLTRNPLEAATAAEEQEEQKWNLVFILADDLGWSDLECYGSDLHETPHLNQLAAKGVRFTNAYAASPVCTPTRASILTGKHPARLRMTTWRESAANRGQRELLEPVTRGDLPLEELTLAETLQEHGYFTAHVGKWHLGTAKFYPQPHGFNMNVGGTLWGAPQSFFYPFRGDDYFQDWRYVPDLEPGEEGDYLTDRLTDRALDIMDQVADQPFYLNLWYHGVHTPIEGKPERVKEFRAKAESSQKHTNPDYAAMVASVDENVGRVLEKLEAKGLAQRTLVVFFSDNGGFVNPCKLHPGVPVTNNAPLRSGKGSLYEGGIRVPLIVHWPGVAPKGGVCDEPVTSCDLFPTLASILNLEPSPSDPLDGVDIQALLKDPTSQLARRSLFFHYPHYYPTTSPVTAVRHGRWKLLNYYDGNRSELYDLDADIGEQRNLASQYPGLVQQLKKKLRAWHAEVDAQHPSVNPQKSE
ncbi:MAG: sulfatase [Pirellulaceae bacterium]